MTTTPSPASQPTVHTPNVDRLDRISEEMGRRRQQPSPARSDKDAERAQLVIDTARADGTTVRPATAHKIAAALAAQESAPSSESIDTPEFRELVEFWSGKYHSALAPVRQGHAKAWERLIAYIDARRATAGTTAAPAEYPHPDCDSACFYHCTEAGTRAPRCMEPKDELNAAWDADYAERATAGNAAPTEARGCTSCEWEGTTDRMCGSVGPLCPVCGDTTEVLASNAATAAPGDLPPTEEMISALLDFLERASHLSHPEVPYHGTINGDSEELWKRRVAAAAIRKVLASNAGAAIPEGWKIPRESNDKLIAFARRWKLDGDWLTCKGCKRSLIASRDGEELNHAAGCKLAAEQHPWAQLRELVTKRAPSNPPAGAEEQTK